MIFWGVSKIQLTCELVKSLQNKKGQKKIEVPDKKAVFFLIKGLFFCRVPQIF